MKKQTIVLAGMPGIEWASENLTGHGGTEVNGNWYYTWEQAMAAAAEVGNGWRLPTQAEFEQLVKSGSTWDGKRKGRVFDVTECVCTAGISFVLGLIDRDLCDECPECDGKGWIYKTTKIIRK